MMMLDIPLVAPGTDGGYYIKESESEFFFCLSIPIDLLTMK